MDKWNKLEIITNFDNSENIENLLYSYDEFSFEKEDNRFEMFENKEGKWDYIDEKYFDNKDTVIFRIYNESDDNNFEDIKKEVLKNSLGTVSISKIDDEDWKNNWKSFYKTIEIGDRLVIKPEWEEYENLDNRIVLEIEPGMAFGTGGHETTRLCLEAIEKYLKKGDSVLDMGCGSGILSIASKKLGALDVLGVDYDKKSVEISKNNSRKENVDIDFRYSDLYENVNGKYDLVISNIIAEIILEVIDGLKNHLKDDGVFIASGILEDKADMVVEKLKSSGYKVLDRKKENEWVLITARRNNA